MRSYRPEELFDDDGPPVPELRGAGARRRRGGWARTRTRTAACCCAICVLPDFRDYAVDVPDAGPDDRARPTRVLGAFLRDVIAQPTRRTSGSFGPDETASNRLDAVFEVTDRTGRRERRRPTSTWPPTAG